MMAAICAARKGAAVTLLEPNERLGKKLNITGKGRCNVTNDSGRDELIAHVPRNGRFLYSAFTRWEGRDTMAFFEALGVPLKVERGKRVYPVSDRSFDISGALEKELRRRNVRMVRDRAEALILKDGRAVGAKSLTERYDADAVIVACGGVSYPATGSTGDGYRLAKQAGHTVIPPRGSLVPLVSDDPDCGAMQGLSLRNVTLTVRNQKHKTVYEELGELLFTHFGVSGPLVLSASSHLRDWSGGPCRLSLDLKPGLEPEQLDARILRDFEKYRNRDFRNALDDLAGRSMIPVLVRRSAIPEETKVHSVTRSQRQNLVRLFKDFSISVTGPRPIAEAIVTAGGVRVGEIDPRTMESKLVRGLYFAGEILDTDAFTGGYNLQIAWSTGHLAGEHL